MALWKTLSAYQKAAYADKARADKKNISGFNTMVSSYVTTLRAGDAYNAPPAGEIMVKDSVTAANIEGAIITIRKTGQSTDYQMKVTDATGKATAAICVEDQNYDLICTALGYTPYSDANLTAIGVWSTHANIELVEL